MGEITNFLPQRVYKFGREPRMKNQMKGPRTQKDFKEGEQKWIHVAPPRSSRLRRKILGKVVEVGVITLFTTFVYTFGGELFWQQAGAPIGTRVSCAAANLVTEWVWSRMGRILEESNLRLVENSNYVDDARTWLQTMKRGTVFNGEKFLWSQDQEDSEEEGVTCAQVTQREFGKALNQITNFLEFTEGEGRGLQ